MFLFKNFVYKIIDRKGISVLSNFVIIFVYRSSTIFVEFIRQYNLIIWKFQKNLQSRLK